MWKTKITTLLKIKYPIIQGPFGGGYSSTKLASIVSNAGGMGSFGAHHLKGTEISSLDAEMKSLTKNAFAINLWIKNEKLDKMFDETAFEKLKIIFKTYFDELNIPLPPFPIQDAESVYHKQVEAILESRPPVFSFVFGIPDLSILRDCKKRKIKTIGTATTVEEALALEAAGVDAVVATGFEAGGHRVSFIRTPEESLTGTFSLIPQVVDNIKIPVLAAGGIADGRGVAAALVLGAAGVQIGTAFLACEESSAPALHREKLFSEEAKLTVLTKAFSGRLARGTSSRIAIETKSEAKHYAPYPLQGLFIRSLRKAALEQRKEELISFWAGQSASLLKHKSAAELFTSLIREAEGNSSRQLFS